LPATVSLDAWLLNQARQRGANLIGERVTEVRTAGRPLVITRNSRLTCDLVVLATGVNHRPVQLPELNYVPPVTRIMSQDELLISDSANEQRIDIFSGYGVGALFVGLIPKGRFTSISILDHEQKKDNIGQFLKMRSQQAMLTSNPLRVCGCNPRIAVSPAQNYYADRFVTVGDAAVTRLYKDGIGSAFLTARQAACVALEVGVSKAAFQQRYAPFCRNIERDNRIGRLLFILWDRMQSSRRLRRAWLNVLLAEEALAAPAQHGRRAVWSMFTGDDSYRAILLQLLNLSILLRFLTGLLWPRLRPR
jgi:flavin-dependent dehydrogenase